LSLLVVLKLGCFMVPFTGPCRHGPEVESRCAGPNYHFGGIGMPRQAGQYANGAKMRARPTAVARTSRMSGEELRTMAVPIIKKTPIRQPVSHWPDRATRIQAGKVSREPQDAVTPPALRAE
jgi:hypothetical protein